MWCCWNIQKGEQESLLAMVQNVQIYINYNAFLLLITTLLADRVATVVT